MKERAKILIKNMFNDYAFIQRNYKIEILEEVDNKVILLLSILNPESEKETKLEHAIELDFDTNTIEIEDDCVNMLLAAFNEENEVDRDSDFWEHLFLNCI